MKQRTGFVSNSSSCSFIITNLTDNDLTLVDFVTENPQLVQEFIEDGYHFMGSDELFTQDNMLECAKTRNELFHPGNNEVSYGDNDGDVLGEVFDYKLRFGGESKRFKWELVSCDR